MPRAVLYSIGIDAWEPTIGLTKDGDIFYAAFQASNQVDVVRSQDEGESWEVVSPRAGAVNRHVSVDPYVYVDEETSRVFTIDLYVGCSVLSYSDDAGDSWITNPIACGRPVNDHQTLFGGPPVAGQTINYPNILYYCWNDVLTSSCSKSLDGGISFSPTGAPAFLPVQEGGAAQCGGLHGQGVVGKDGTVYLPREYCGEPWLAISNDEGLSWTRMQVAANGVAFDDAFGSAADPAVAVDPKGNLYYTWVADDQLPYLSISRDGGQTWGDPMMVGAPGVKATSMITIASGAPGRVAFAYMGTDRREANSGSQTTARWNGFIGITAQALNRRPVFVSAMVNPPSYPLKRGTCGVRRCNEVGDFLDVQIGTDGTPWAAFVDACAAAQGCGGPIRPGAQGTGAAARLVGGPRLR